MRFHGTVFDYYGNRVLNSNSYANNLGGVIQQENTRNNFGGVLGGPIRKNKTFFLASYEGWRQANPLSTTDSVPPLAWRTGNFSQSGYSLYDPLTSACTTTNAQGQCTQYKRTQFPNNIIPASRISPIGQAIVNLYPTPTNASPNNNYPTAGTHNIVFDQYLGRVDQYFSENTRFYAMGQVLRNYALIGGNGFTNVASSQDVENGLPFIGMVALTKVIFSFAGCGRQVIVFPLHRRLPVRAHHSARLHGRQDWWSEHAFGTHYDASESRPTSRGDRLYHALRQHRQRHRRQRLGLQRKSLAGQRPAQSALWR